MRSKKAALAGLLVFIFLLTGCAWQRDLLDRSLTVAQLRGTLRVGIAPMGAPFAYEEDGQASGYAVDAAALLVSGMGLDIEWVIADRDALAEKLAAYEIDIAIADAIPGAEQDRQYHLIGPYFHDPYVYVYPADQEDTQFTDIAAWEEDPAAGESYVLCPTWADALLTVDDGGAEAALLPLSAAAALLYDWEGYAAARADGEYASYMMVMRLEDGHLAEAVSAVMDTIRDTTAFTDLQDKWYDILDS
jgi:ABC-type amino acid transport substrate-binding protein